MQSPISRSLLVSLTALAALVAGCDGGSTDTTPSAPTSAPERPDRGGTPEPEVQRDGPSIDFEEISVDFGIVNATKPLTSEFFFTNRGDEELVIDEVKAACGCTTVDLEKMNYAPGERASIRAEWDPGGIGKQTKTVDVTTNGDPPFVRLSLSAQISPFLRLEQFKPNFGTVDFKETHTLLVNMECDDPAAEIVSVVSKNTHMLADVLPASDGSDFPWVLQLTLKDTAAQGSFLGGITVRVRGNTPEGEPVDHEFDWVARGKVYGPVRADPSDFLVGRVNAGGQIKSTVHLWHKDGHAFNVVNTQIKSATVPGMKVTAIPVQGENERTIDLVLEGETGEFTGLLRADVLVWTDAGEPLEFKVMGAVR